MSPGSDITSVPVGLTTKGGIAAIIVGLLPSIIQIIEQGVSAYHIGGVTKWGALLAVVATVVTLAGRFLQSHAKIKVGN